LRDALTFPEQSCRSGHRLVSGADPIETRPGFSALLDRIEDNGVRAVVVEDASRFARDLVAQELGILLLVKRGVRLLTVNGDDLCDTSDPSRVMMRQIAGAFAQYETASNRSMSACALHFVTEASNGRLPGSSPHRSCAAPTWRVFSLLVIAY
jgi:DNA invertase Pin-like site-specific DNA recombinase